MGAPKRQGKPWSSSWQQCRGRAARLAQSVVGTERMGTGIWEKPVPFSQESISESGEAGVYLRRFYPFLCLYLQSGEGSFGVQPFLQEALSRSPTPLEMWVENEGEVGGSPPGSFRPQTLPR